MLRKLIALTVLSLATLFVAMPPQQVKAINAVRYYTVYNDCFSPAGIVVGEWTRDCNGEWYGWGDMPGADACTRHVMTIGDACDR